MLFFYGEQEYRRGESVNFLQSLLAPATRLRIVDEKFISGEPPYDRDENLNWRTSPQVEDVLGIFLKGLPFLSSDNLSHCSYFHVDRSYFHANYEQNLRLRKFVDFPVDPYSEASLPEAQEMAYFLQPMFP